jgi:hypothetical protein
MTTEEKAKKFDEIQQYMWNAAYSDNLAASTFCAALIRILKIEGPEGEEPDFA